MYLRRETAFQLLCSMTTSLQHLLYSYEPSSWSARFLDFTSTVELKKRTRFIPSNLRSNFVDRIYYSLLKIQANNGIHLQRLAWDVTFFLHRYRTSVCAFNRGNPLFPNIQHVGRASRGGRSPVNKSSDERQAWLNLNAWLPCVMGNYVKRGWNKLSTRRFVPVNFKNETLCSKSHYLSNQTTGQVDT